MSMGKMCIRDSYYTSYDNSTITGVDMGRENLDADEVVTYPMNDKPALVIKN